MLNFFEQTLMQKKHKSTFFVRSGYYAKIDLHLPLPNSCQLARALVAAALFASERVSSRLWIITFSAKETMECLIRSESVMSAFPGGVYRDPDLSLLRGKHVLIVEHCSVMGFVMEAVIAVSDDFYP